MKTLTETTLRYITYQVLLESSLTSQERDRLIEAGLLDKIKGWLGGVKDAAAELGGSAASLIKSKEFSRRMVSAEKNIRKEVDDLKALAQKAGQPEDAVYGILSKIMDKAGASTQQLSNPPKPDASGGQGGTSSGAKAKPGTPLKSGDASSTSNLAAAAGEAAGQDPADAASAEEKKVSPDKATEVLGKAIANKAGVDAKAGIAVVKALIDTGHLVAEGMYRLTSSDVKRALNEIRGAEQSENIFERWQGLAGLLIERNKENKAAKDAMRKSGQLTAAGSSAGDGTRSPEATADATKANEKKYAAGVKKGETAKAAAQAKKADGKPAASEANKPDAVKGAAAKPGDDKDKGADAKTAEAQKKYGAAFKSVKDKLKDSVDDKSIAAVLTALDDLKAIEVK